MIKDQERLRVEYARRQHRLKGSDTYSVFNTANLFMVQQRQRDVLRLLRQKGYFPLKEKSIMEVGCGEGGVLIEFLGFGASSCNLYGVDLLIDRLTQAHCSLFGSNFANADGQSLPYSSKTFDLVLQYTAISSILDPQIRSNICADMLRVLKPGGMILSYDFWLNPTNPQTRGVVPSEIKRLFPNCYCEFQRITLAPPIARRLVPISWLFCAFLEKLKIFNTHYLVAIQRL